jgi:CheY-like chemotaxis protein
LRAAGDEVELTVRDTGVGTPPEEIPRLFERFHRTEGARGRTQEGSGIGLALVRELVELHGGDIRAESDFGKGTAFFVRIPFGSDHLPPDRVGAPRVAASTSIGARPFIEEALRWIPDARDGATTLGPSDEEVTAARSGAGRPRILVADDNADMLSYVCRLLRERYDVVAVRDGLAALEVVRKEPLDLIVSDVMMPGLDWCCSPPGPARRLGWKGCRRERMTT